MVSTYSSNFVDGESIIQPDSFQEGQQDGRIWPLVKCMVNGRIRLVGEAVFIEAREAEFDDEYEDGMELRDYAMVGLGRDDKPFNVIASILVPVDHQQQKNLLVRRCAWRIKASYPAVA